MKIEDISSFEGVCKIVGNATKEMYGINPYEKKCEQCNDTGKILKSPTGSDEDCEEEFCSCLKGRSLINQLTCN